ncbi:hypothetical protein LPB16_23020 (plasmid) [Salmonella enterica subsp. enterica]
MSDIVVAASGNDSHEYFTSRHRSNGWVRGDYTYRGTITVTGEALIGPAVDARVPKVSVTLCSSTKVTVEQCNARLERKNQDGSWNVVTGMQCTGQNSNNLSVVTPISKIYKLVYGDFYRVVFMNVRARFEPSGAAEHGSRCFVEKQSYSYGNPVSGGVLELSTLSGQTERLAAYGQHETTFLMPVTAVDKTYIEYPTMTRLSVAPDGSARGQVVTVVGRNAQVKFTLREAYGNNNLGQYWIPTAASGSKIKPQLIKRTDHNVSMPVKGSHVTFIIHRDLYLQDDTTAAMWTFTPRYIDVTVK